MQLANTAWALVPVLTVLLVSVLTRDALFGLICASLVGSVLLGGWDFFAKMQDVFGKALSSDTMHWLAMVVTLFGVLIAYLNASGAVSEFATWAERFVTSRRKSLVLSFLLTIALFVDDYLNALTVGTTMKRVTDGYRVPRTLLGTIVKLTSAPIALMIPFSTWAVFFSGLLADEGVKVHGSGFEAYLYSLPFVFFGWISLLLAFLLAMGWLPLVGPLRRADVVARESGQTRPEGRAVEASHTERVDVVIGYRKPQPWGFLVPMLVLVVVTIITGANIVNGAMVAVVTAIVLCLAMRRLTMQQIFTQAMRGVKDMVYVFVLFVLAFMVQQINTELMFSDWLIRTATPVLSGAVLPALVFVLCGIYAYATGAFWDLAVVITPVALPLANAVGVSPLLTAAAVFSGAALGSTTCLYGDGIVLASRSVGVKPLQLMLSILPYAGFAAVLTTIAYLVTGLLMTG